MKDIVSIALVSLIVAVMAAVASAQVITGGYRTVAVDNEYVVKAAQFAVENRAETNPEQEGLTLGSVDKAQSQTVGGINYKLCMTVTLDDESQQVSSLVFQSLQRTYTLKSWTVEDCAPVSTGSTRGASRKPAVPKCSGDKLSFKETEGEGDIGGKSYARFLFTNISSAPCSLYGYPKFALFDRKEREMAGVKVVIAEESDKPTRVTLKPGKTAWFQVFYTDGMIAAGLRKPAPASYEIKVKAPRAEKEFVIKSQIHAYKEVRVYFLRDGVPD
jgi:hypothetical protein